MASEQQTASYIVIEGVIGVGKTSLSRLLAEEMDARLNLEIVEENPFLSEFYSDPRSNAFKTQVFFLLSRYRQQQSLFQGELFQSRVVSDYHFDKDRIFANINLSDDELGLYNLVADALTPRVPTPDLVIFLQASMDKILERIARRGRPMERDIRRDYLESLAEAYNHYFFHYTGTPLLVVNTDNIDFVSSRQQLLDLKARILTPFEGTLYYVPTWED
ncbi:MAG: deoxynucleoside kinase [Candidatus Krumholzibacteria bacterium]|jgi:deoxyadenosine/deoxycytidine kinase|nr:deoxynucleoside kinase [Candidatus Krumholzibacteria bacterium]MDP6669220.1 deoxynucleoside kinase [Candidatus Krumholzibacteria bacterium]MDP6796463.1 deoxynucleoside kinase [Candidatus Krumholzibacteria bacterium]MDP7021593.1 deoxynucleoside kinase [Candidatus Krumholzibacteria bacterium]